jgi:hypothetical protein
MTGTQETCYIILEISYIIPTFPDDKTPPAISLNMVLIPSHAMNPHSPARKGALTHAVVPPWG